MAQGAIMNQTPNAVSRTGDIMTGPLILSGPPTQTNGAATKGYVDDYVANNNILQLELLSTHTPTSLEGDYFNFDGSIFAFYVLIKNLTIPQGETIYLKFNSYLAGRNSVALLGNQFGADEFNASVFLPVIQVLSTDFNQMLLSTGCILGETSSHGLHYIEVPYGQTATEVDSFTSGTISVYGVKFNL